MTAPAFTRGGHQKRIRINSGSIPALALLSTAAPSHLTKTVTA